MTDFARARAIALLSAAAGVAVIFALMAAGFEAVFAHSCGYGVGLVTALALASRSKSPSVDVASPDRALLVLGYVIAYSISLGSLLLQLGRSVDPYVAQTVAAGVFLAALLLLARAAPFIYRELAKPAAGPVSRRHDKVRSAVAAIVAFARDARVGRTLLIAFFILVVIVDLRAVVWFYRTADERAAVPNYQRVSTWISQAECFKKTGVVFATCDPSGVLIPVEDATIADDRGQGLLLSVLHRWFPIPATKQSLVFVNAIFSVLAFALLAWQFVRLHRAIAAMIFFGLTLRLVSSSFFDADAFSTFFGLFALSLLLPLQVLRMFAQQHPHPNEWAWLVAAGLALACAVLFREPIGLIGCVMTLLALALGLLHRIRALRAHDIVVAGGAVAAILLALNAGGLLTAYRIHYQGVPAGKGIISHGIAHNLYIGLGSEPNEPSPFGIQWSDSAGENAVKAVDPTIPYASEKYFDTLMSLYFKAVRDHPFAVARIYASRMSRVLGPLILPIIFITLAAIFAGLALPRAQGPPSPYHHVLIDFSLVVAIGTLLQAAQAVLTVPTLAYYFQADLGLYVLGALAFDVWFRVIWSDPFRRGRDRDRRADDLLRPQTANNPERQQSYS